MEKKAYLMPAVEVLELMDETPILAGTNDAPFDPSAPIIIEPTKPDPDNPPTPAF